jgi:pyruvate/2-oxoglutarate/acetoin dehydrogenase E1 component
LCEQALPILKELGISIELIDVQTLLPFDIHAIIADSLKNTNRLLLVDEDVSSGATAFMLDQILVKQDGYRYLDSAPVTLSAKDHRPAYGTDGDYFSKPSIDDIVEAAYLMMNEVDPSMFPSIY